MEIFGRLTADAKVNQSKNGKKVVNFSIAMNESYKTKDSTEFKRFTTYFNCSYWINDRIAKVLTKGTLVELYERVHVSTYTNHAGDIKASLNFHVSNIKLHGKPVPEKTALREPVEENANEKEAHDLPF